MEAERTDNDPIVGTGVDIVQISRLRRIDLKAPFYRRVFTTREMEYCKRFDDPLPHLAGVFAAKEAVWKSISHLSPPALSGIEILHDPPGRPQVHLSGHVDCRVHLSISHSGDYAVAVAIAVDSEMGIDGDYASRLASLVTDLIQSKEVPR